MAAFRELRRRYLSFLPTGQTTRRWRWGLLRRLGLTRTRDPRWLCLRPELRYGDLFGLATGALIAHRGELSFVQIGAYDGLHSDELCEFTLRYPCQGVFVEPQPAAYERLKQNYGDRPGMQFVNAAIDSKPGEREFFTPRNQDCTQSSFDRAHLLKHNIPASEIISNKVPCRTVDSVLEEAALPRVDLLMIDTEGHDAVVLQSIDLARWQPAMIRFETMHLSTKEVDSCCEYLASHGYQFLVEQLDLIAVRRDWSTAPSQDQPSKKEAA